MGSTATKGWRPTQAIDELLFPSQSNLEWNRIGCETASLA
jgi:hypothetical protein